jgi:hypothetical protein
MGGHSDDFCFHAAQAGEGSGIQCVLREKQVIGFFQQFVGIGARMIDQTEGLALAPLYVVLAHGVHSLQNHVFWVPVAGSRTRLLLIVVPSVNLT